jgi:hypothetical protein
MKSMRWVLGLAGWAVLAGLAAGCAKSSEAPAAAPAQEPGTPGTLSAAEQPQTLADAEALLEKSRADLDRLALNEPAPPAPVAAGAAAPTTAPAPAPAAEAAPRDEARSADKAAAEAPRSKEVSTCETACKAFSSLTRASDAVCRLDTEGKRCERARQIQQDAGRRVSSCSCTP